MREEAVVYRQTDAQVSDGGGLFIAVRGRGVAAGRAWLQSSFSAMVDHHQPWRSSKQPSPICPSVFF